MQTQCNFSFKKPKYQRQGHRWHTGNWHIEQRDFANEGMQFCDPKRDDK